MRKLPDGLRTFLRSVGIGKPKGVKATGDISYAKLKKKISTTHPVDPLTQQKFDFGESVTIHNYGLKLSDALFCSRIYNCLRQAQKNVVAFCLGRKKKDF